MSLKENSDMKPAHRANPTVGPSDWPGLPYRAWGDTIATLHRWFQIVGKVRMELSPWVNHSWNAALYAQPAYPLKTRKG